MLEIFKNSQECLILVHGNPLNYDYQWDLESFGLLYDVDITVHGEICIALIKFILSRFHLVSTHMDPHKHELRHHQETL